MLIDISFYKLDISPKNSPIFSSKEDREQFFENNKAISLENISYNGTRKIRINANFLNVLKNFYNYCSIKNKSTGEVIYCFIDNVSFLNDNSIELSLTMDYIVTFYFDIKFFNPEIKQVTLPYDIDIAFEDKKLPYSNTIPFSSKYKRESTQLYFEPFYADGVAGDYSLKFALISVEIDDTTNSSAIYKSGITKNLCLILPYIFKYRSLTQSTLQYINPWFFKIDGKEILDNDAIFNKYQAKIINVSFIDNIFGKTLIKDVTDFSQTYVDDGYNITILKDGGGAIAVLMRSSSILEDSDYNIFLTETDSKFIPSLTKKLPYSLVKLRNETTIKNNLIENSNYVSLDLVYNNSEKLFSISKKDFYNFDENIFIKLTLDICYPNSFDITVFSENDTNVGEFTDPSNLRIKIHCKATGVQYSVSQWAEYYLNNSASINDGLKTKHSYDLENAEIQKTAGLINAGLDYASGALNIIGGGVTAAATGGAAGTQSITGGASQIIDATQSIVSTTAAYDIAVNNIEQEKAMLNIAWNDIKARPYKPNNIGVDNNLDCVSFNGLEIYKIIPTDYYKEYLRKYHAIYGYAINIILNDEKSLNELLSSIDNSNIKNLKYKFIRVEGDMIIDNLPIKTQEIIKSIFSDGIKFYAKDNMLKSLNPENQNFIPSSIFN